jgi:hypothetical protein
MRKHLESFLRIRNQMLSSFCSVGQQACCLRDIKEPLPLKEQCENHAFVCWHLRPNNRKIFPDVLERISHSYAMERIVVFVTIRYRYLHHHQTMQ